MRRPDWLRAATFAGVLQTALAAVNAIRWGWFPFRESVYIAVSAYFAAAAVYIGRQSERVFADAEALGAVNTAALLARVVSGRAALVVFGFFEGGFLALIFLVQGVPLPATAASGVFADSFLTVLLGSSVIWAFAASMWGLYAVGRQPLRLRPFTDDRTLGLRRFAGAALRLVAVYEIGVFAVGFLPIVVEDFEPTGIPLYAFFGLVGLVLFFLPLVSFHRRLVNARNAELGWIRPRYAALVAAVQTSTGAGVDERTGSSLLALRELQRDVESLPTWPFDASIDSRLASITILPVAITVVAREVILLTLHV